MADFTNIDGKYAKDTELRSGIDTLRTTVLSNTIKPLTVTKNDTYTAIPSSGTYGYSPITVDVQEEPWQPLQDGYSNFWFELDNDTLSPWLNFSAKNNDATIDWGDGSGEQSLDTLTPTHTYSKAGKYIVKVKGVTGLARQHTTSSDTNYFTVLKYVELNSEVTGLNLAFWKCFGLKKCVANNLTGVANGVFQYCSNLEYFNTGVSPTLPNYFASNCFSIKEVVIPNTVTAIGDYTFSQCYSLTKIHVQATTPPTLGTATFSSIPSNYTIYVPTGTLSAYQTAWSDYSDHIVEEGSSLSVQQLRKIAEETDNEEMR